VIRFGPAESKPGQVRRPASRGPNRKTGQKIVSVSGNSTNRTPQLSLRKKLLFSLAFAATAAIALEAGVRLVCWAIGRVPYTAATPWCVADDDLLYVFKPHFKGTIYHVAARINNHGLRGEDFATRKPRGLRRVLCLGDSRTFGYKVGQDQPYPARLERLWRNRHPDRPLQVINAGMPGYSSYQGLRFLELRGLRFDPDVVTVAFNFNDRRFVLRPEQADSPEWFRRAARGLRLRHRLGFSYALLGLAKILRRARGTDTWRRDVLGLPSQKLDDLACRVEPDAFRENLRKIARICRRRRIGLVLVAMNDKPAIVRLMTEGERLRSQGKYDEAIEAFSRIGRYPPDHETERWFRALVLYEIGLTHEAEGKTEQAAADFRRSAQAAAFWSVFGGTPIRRSSKYLEAMRAVAREFNAPCLDLEKLPTYGDRIFADYCHFTAEGHNLIAENLADRIEKNHLLDRR